MAAYTSFLLVAALCLGTAYSLKCYTCALAASNADCMTATNCTTGLNYCSSLSASVSAYGISTSTITKTCAATCTASSTSVSGVTSRVTCCQTDLCNSAPAIESRRATIFVLLGTAVTLLSGSML